MTITLPVPDGFTLDAAAEFADGFPGTRTQQSRGELSVAWALDGDWRTVRVTLRHHGDEIYGEVDGAHPSRELTIAARRDLERILSLDVDGSGFTALGHRDEVVGGLQDQFPGLRPVLFFTPYEAAAWCVIGHRIRMSQAATVMQHLGDTLGEQGAFPSPAALSGLTAPVRGLSETKVTQLRELAGAALEGSLDRDRLRATDYDHAGTALRDLPGIGPFSAELIVIRGVGAPDALPHHEKRLLAATREAYHLPGDADITEVTQAWRPYRAWVALLLRAGAVS